MRKQHTTVRISVSICQLEAVKAVKRLCDRGENAWIVSSALDRETYFILCASLKCMMSVIHEVACKLPNFVRSLFLRKYSENRASEYCFLRLENG